MPLFSRFKNKGAQPVSKGHLTDGPANGHLATASRPKWSSNWNSKVIVPEEVEELIHACTAEMKTRAEALDSPFLLLPFRPHTDSAGARTFIGNFYKSNHDGSSQYRGASLQKELRLTEPIVLCSILKWCWSRIPAGVVSWPVYDGFSIGEQEANLARNAFETFIPISADSQARNSIIFDFYDLLAAVAAHGKMNGLGGRKLSRLAGWWAFEHSDDGKGFEGGYRSWTAAADASSHLFFAYLRTLSPEEHPSMSIIERIPRSLQALLASTEYPPETPTLMQKSTPRVVMLVDSVSPTPFALLRRAKHFEYRSSDSVLREYSEVDDPIDALTEECKRVLYAISNTNSSAAKSRHRNAIQGDESWSAFQNTGFADWDDKPVQNSASNGPNRAGGSLASQGLRSEPRSSDHARPTTPSWADFMSSGFAEDEWSKPSSTLLLPPDKQLPPLSRATSPNYMIDEHDIAPGELAAIANVDLDDAFWWVWMTSLASEEPAERKAVFGRCAVIETSIRHGRWLIMEEQVKGASPEPADGTYIANKKSIFSFKRGKLSRKRSTNKVPLPSAPETIAQPLASPTPSRRSLAPDQQSKIKEAAEALKKQEVKDDDSMTRRGRQSESTHTKTNSVLTMGLRSEAGPAMQWTNAYDKSTIRAAYLGDPFAGRGRSREDLRTLSSINLNGYDSSAAPTPGAALSPDATPVITSDIGRELPSLPAEAGVGKAEPDAVAPAETPAAATNTSLGAAPTPQDTDKELVSNDGPTQPMSAMDKEIGVDPSSLNRRKPVPRTDDHPAHRQADAQEPSSVPQTPTSPAAIAAKAAMAPKTSTESTKNTQKLKKQQGGGAIKKLFGRKKDNPNRQSVDGSRGGGLAAPSDSNLARKSSLLRKKPTATEPLKQSQLETMHPNASELEAEPVMSDSLAYQHPGTGVSHNDSVQDANPEHEFARFDQGGVETPQQSSQDLLAAPQAQRTFNVNEHLASQADAQADDDDELEPEHEDPHTQQFTGVEDDTQSEATMEDQQEGLTESKDRWATIRENAARRAAARASEEQSTQSRPSQSVKTDDGETSGEETIESRVARIKARVAELTGGVERR